MGGLGRSPMTIMLIMASVLKGVCFVLLIGITSVFGLHVLFIPAILTFFTSPGLHTTYVSGVLYFWTHLVSGLFELLGIKMKLVGDLKKISKRVPTLIILNHRTRFDWFFLFTMFRHVGRLENVRIILKSSLKSVPVFGPGTQLLNFIFLKRKWAEDEVHLTESLQYYADMKFPMELVIFPEGTDLSPGNRQRDRDYALKNNLPLNKCVLHPRTTGFVKCVQTLQEENKYPYFDVCDVSIGYIGDIPQGESQLLKGHWPREIHFHIKYHPSSSLPSSDEELGEWLKKRWREKDELLTQFYETNSFPGPVLRETLMSRLKILALLVAWLVLCTAVVYYWIQATLFMTIIMGIPFVIHYVVHKYFDGWDKLMLKKWKLKKRD